MSRDACPPHRRHLYVRSLEGRIVERSQTCLRCGKPRVAAYSVRTESTRGSKRVEENSGPARETR